MATQAVSGSPSPQSRPSSSEGRPASRTRQERDSGGELGAEGDVSRYRLGDELFPNPANLIIGPPVFVRSVVPRLRAAYACRPREGRRAVVADVSRRRRSLAGPAAAGPTGRAAPPPPTPPSITAPHEVASFNAYLKSPGVTPASALAGSVTAELPGPGGKVQESHDVTLPSQPGTKQPLIITPASQLTASVNSPNDRALTDMKLDTFGRNPSTCATPLNPTTSTSC